MTGVLSVTATTGPGDWTEDLCRIAQHDTRSQTEYSPAIGMSHLPNNLHGAYD
jgi:hypothetical protein